MYAFTQRDGYNFLSCRQGRTPKYVLSCADKGAGELQHLLLIQSLSERRRKKVQSALVEKPSIISLYFKHVVVCLQQCGFSGPGQHHFLILFNWI